MCGIAGAVDLIGRRSFAPERLLAMTRALAHRGPDDEHVHLEPGLALGVRRLAIIDVAGGRQPLANEDGRVWVAYEGELYNYAKLREQLLARGHLLRTRCDTEAWVHLYEDHGEAVFDRARGQFAVALWDAARRSLLLGRDRVGIAPLFYAEAEGWLLWASEIKALLSSGLINPQPDRKALDYFFNFFVLPIRRSCFKNVRSLPPGHFLKVRDGKVECRQYWDLEFPDAGQERRFARPEDAAGELESLLRQAVQARFLSERPVCCYLSGGVDSATILGLATMERGEPVPSFTIGLDRSGPTDERSQAAEAAALFGSPLTTVNMTAADIANAYAETVWAGEGPVLDTSAACMLRLAQAVRDHGYVVSLTGEGADEALAGYAWFKIDPLARLMGRYGYGLGRWLLLSALTGGGRAHRPPFAATAGLRTSHQFPYEIMAQSRERLFSRDLWKTLAGYSAYDDLALPPERMRRWDPLNQSLYLAYKVMLPGLLLAAKGDRPMHNASTEGRYPFLDETVIAFCACLDPRLKVRRLTDKRVLRILGRKILPPAIANRHKTMFRAHMSSTFLGPDRPAWVDQVLSPEALKATGYFDVEGVRFAREVQLSKPRCSFQRFVFDMGLMGVLGTQVWHHMYCGGGLADLPTWEAPRLDQREIVGVMSRSASASVSPAPV
jgi:asparagine synthase (glutamine-hydrolysing)